MSNQPASALSSPRFCNMGTFMRMPHIQSAKGLDFAIAGAPFDTASSFRSGSRFGPHATVSYTHLQNHNTCMVANSFLQRLQYTFCLTDLFLRGGKCGVDLSLIHI